MNVLRGAIPRAFWSALVGSLVLLTVILQPGFASAQEDITEGVRGTIQVRTEDGQTPLEGVTITVTDAEGEVVNEALTDADGMWQVEVPGPGEYSVTLDVATLPEGVVLTREGDNVRQLTVNRTQVRPVLFPLSAGDAAPSTGGGGIQEGPLGRFLQLFAEGLRLGLLLALMAIGLSLIFGTTGLVNFAHGEMVTYGAVVAFLFNVTLGMNFFLAAALAIVIGAMTGALLDMSVFRPLRRMGVSLIAQLVVTIGLSLLWRYLILYLFRGDFRSYASYSVQQGVDIGIARLAPKDLWSMGIAVAVLVGVGLLLQLTRIGKAMRAVSDNRDLAESTGIDVQRVILIVWATGAGLAALAGILWGLSESVSWIFGFRVLLLIFAGVTLGGLGTAYGALVGSLVVGVFIQVSTLIVPTELKNVGAMAILIIVLVFRPQGILGKAERVG